MADSPQFRADHIGSLLRPEPLLEARRPGSSPRSSACSASEVTAVPGDSDQQNANPKRSAREAIYPAET